MKPSISTFRSKFGTVVFIASSGALLVAEVEQDLRSTVHRLFQALVVCGGSLVEKQ
jgi:hypothetical protein